MPTRIVDDYPADLVPLAETRTCSKCKAFTWWATSRQIKHGRCWDCISGQYSRYASTEHELRILTLILTTFPGSTVTVDWKPRRYRPGEYHGPDVGPCRRCGGLIHLYGWAGWPLCLDCEGDS